METVSIDNIFNYVPSKLRNQLGDDDQIRSWALQALRAFNMHELQYIRDIFFGEVVDHKLKIPENSQRIVRISRVTSEGFKAFKELVHGCACDTEEKREPQYNSYACPMPIFHRIAVAKDWWQQENQPIKLISGVSKNIICGNDGCASVATISEDGCDVLFDFKEGLVAVMYDRFSESEDIQIPVRPEVIWQYMRSYITTQYYREMVISFPELVSMLEYAQGEQLQFAHSLRAKLVMKNIDLKAHLQMLNGRLLMAPSMIKQREHDFKIYG